MLATILRKFLQCYFNRSSQIHHNYCSDIPETCVLLWYNGDVKKQVNDKTHD